MSRSYSPFVSFCLRILHSYRKLQRILSSYVRQRGCNLPFGVRFRLQLGQSKSDRYSNLRRFWLDESQMRGAFWLVSKCLKICGTSVILVTISKAPRDRERIKLSKTEALVYTWSLRDFLLGILSQNVCPLKRKTYRPPPPRPDSLFHQ